MIARRLALAAPLCAFLVTSAAAVAEESPEERALRLYRAGDYAGAVTLLQGVLERSPSPAVHRALASCYLKLGDDERAEVHLRAYLAEAPPGGERDQAEARLAEVSARLATSPVRLTSEPPGASVYVDDRPAGATPLDLRLAPGEHALRLVLAGHRDFSGAIQVRRATALELPVTLSPLPPAPPARPEPPRPPVLPEPVRVPGTVAPGAVIPALPAPRSTRPLRTGAIVLAVVAVVSTSVGFGLYGGSYRAADRASSASDPAAFLAARNDVDTQYLGGVSLLAVGGATAAAAAALLVGDAVRARRSRLSIAPAGAGLVVEGRF